jgi:hypothetical protein
MVAIKTLGGQAKRKLNDAVRYTDVVDVYQKVKSARSAQSQALLIEEEKEIFKDIKEK